jgi:serine/threonine protein phosphatase PrpC
MLQFQYLSAQEIGTREAQEDAFFICPPAALRAGETLLIVADGVGTVSHGTKIGQYAIDAFTASYFGRLKDLGVVKSLHLALLAANDAAFVLCSSQQNESNTQNGTTFTAIAVYNDCLYWVSVGDSRAYIFRSNELVQLTKDHVSEAHGGALTSFLGAKYIPEIDLSKQGIPLRSNDRILLCTDGLYMNLDDSEMATALEGEFNQTIEKLLRAIAAKNNPEQDNISIVVMDCNGEIDQPALKHSFSAKSVATTPIDKNYLTILIVISVIVIFAGIFFNTLTH